MQAAAKMVKLLSMEGYLDCFDNHRYDNLTIAQLKQKALMDAVSATKLMDLRRSTLLNSVVSGVGASLTLEEVVDDLKDLNWQECHVTSLLTQGAADSDSSSTTTGIAAAPVNWKLPKKVKSRLVAGIEANSSVDSTGAVMSKLKTVKKARNDLHPKYHMEGASMATEKLNKPPSLPPYTQTIMEDALKQTEVGKRKAAIVPKAAKKKAKKEKAKKDPNEPKRPPPAFCMFIKEFQNTFKKENPNVKANTKDVLKAGGEKWKSMSAAEKAPFQAKAAEKKVEYEKLMNAYNKTQRSSAHGGDEGSNKSRSEIHDDEA